MIRSSLSGLASLCILFACAAPSPDSEGDVAHAADTVAEPVTSDDLATQIDAGAEIAELNCFICHSASIDTQSPNPLAPSMAAIFERYPDTALFDDLRTGIHLGHETMPTFDFTVQETDALLAFLRSIQNVQPE